MHVYTFHHGDLQGVVVQCIWTVVIVTRLPASQGDDDISTGSGDPQWETKSRFTEYSITSSVLPRSEGTYVVRLSDSELSW